MHELNELGGLTCEMTLDLKQILPIRSYRMKSFVDRQVFVLQREELFVVHIGEDCPEGGR